MPFGTVDRSSLYRLAGLTSQAVQGALALQESRLQQDQLRRERSTISTILGETEEALGKPGLTPSEQRREKGRGVSRLLAAGTDRATKAADVLARREIDDKEPANQLLGFKDVNEGGEVTRFHEFGTPGVGGAAPIVRDIKATQIGKNTAGGEGGSGGKLSDIEKQIEEYRRQFVQSRSELNSLMEGRSTAVVQDALRQVRANPTLAPLMTQRDEVVDMVLRGMDPELTEKFRLARDYMRLTGKVEGWKKTLRGYRQDPKAPHGYEVGENDALVPIMPQGSTVNAPVRESVAPPGLDRKSVERTFQHGTTGKAAGDSNLDEGEIEYVSQEEYDSAVEELVKNKGYEPEEARKYLHKNKIRPKTVQ